MEKSIRIYKAKEHNLKNIDLELPHYQLIVFTGVSGSGKSSLAFDTIYAEGQRRYLDTFSAYARQFMGELRRPDVEKIDGLCPVVAIEQKTTSKNPRSTVGTITEIYDLLRLLFARISTPYNPKTDQALRQFSEDEIPNLVVEKFKEQSILILSPVIKGRKGHYRELFESFLKQGFKRARIDGELVDLKKGQKVDRYKTHDIELLVDEIKVGTLNKRLKNSIQFALEKGKGTILVLPSVEITKEYWLSKFFMDAESGLSYDLPAPNNFSFNSPYGACPKCKGLGYDLIPDIDLIVPDRKLPIEKGAIAPLGKQKKSWVFKELKILFRNLGLSFHTPFEDLPENIQKIILDGGNYKFSIEKTSQTITYTDRFMGIIPYINNQIHSTDSPNIRRAMEAFTSKKTCKKCGGSRLGETSLHFKVAGKNIYELASLDLGALQNWIDSLNSNLNEKQLLIAEEVIKEIRQRLNFLDDVGLNYLNLNRETRTLSGGEAQRIRLATQIGTQLVGVLYIMDEPSIGLHARDNEKLINSLRNLCDIGNSIIVVEHDKEMMLASDFIVDLGPGAGNFGGEIVAKGDVKTFLASENSQTAVYLKDKYSIKVPKNRRSEFDKFLTLKGASGNNLKAVNLEIPLGVFVCVSGVSGSGKSSLINHTLYPILMRTFHKSKLSSLAYESVEGLEYLDKVVNIDQSPIGRTPRSNPATYIGLFTYIRDLFAQLPESKIRGYKAGRFSFNVKGGRCETCKGAGVQTIEMNFLPNVYVDCPDCRGKRYNRETLEVRYKGKSINDVLNMSFEEAFTFFEAHPRINRIIKTMLDVGLGYITLGQSAVTISGGEAQRVKIAKELKKISTGKTIYILDEPTTGLHFQDIEKLITVLQKLVDKSNTVLVIEHNMEVIKTADWLIDMGPEGGNAGGQIIAEGSPEAVAKNKKSLTGKFLAKEL